MTALMAWPNFHREMEREVGVRWQHGCNENAQLAPSGILNSLTESAGGRVATALVGAQKQERRTERNIRATAPLSFLTEW